MTKVTLNIEAQTNWVVSQPSDISKVENKLKTEFNIVIDKRKIIDKFLINAFGYTKLRIELYKGVVGIINVHVSEE